MKVPQEAIIRPMYHSYRSQITDLDVDFTKEGKPENPKKNPRSTGETNYNNFTHTSSKFENEHRVMPRCQVVIHPAITLSDRASEAQKGL